MLNELLTLKRGAEAAGIELEIRHPDIKDSRNIPTFVVTLDEKGRAIGIRIKPTEITPWTLRDGMHNSFPFVQIKSALMTHEFSSEDPMILQALDRRNEERRTSFQKLLKKFEHNTDSLAEWPPDGLIKRVQERLIETQGISPAGKVVALTMERFVHACSKPNGGETLLRSISKLVISEIKKNADNSFLDTAIGLLLGKFDAKQNEWENQSGILFEASHKTSKPIFHSKVLSALSDCLNTVEKQDETKAHATCGLTSKSVAIIQDKFPQPNLPVLGQTYLFARNGASKANTRYGQSSVETMPVGVDIANSLSAALSELTDDSRVNITWRAIPGEAPKQKDLLIAYVEQALNTAVVQGLTEEFEDFEEESDHQGSSPSVASFEAQTTRLVESIKGVVDGDFRNSKVRFLVFRKLDPANRKIVFSSSRKTGSLYDAATDWGLGERNLPSHLSLVAKFGKSKPAKRKPPHVAPLGLIAFSKKIFRRGGEDSQEVAGLTASEAMLLFLDRASSSDVAKNRRVERFLRMILRRRGELCKNASHLLRKNKMDLVNKQNREALRTATVIGLLLHKLNRKKEQYMSETAFKLGQLLAAADVVHAGYCIDVRAGSIPPSLLGNQMFAMAQSSPEKALALWCRRWKPYDGWARKLQHKPEKIATYESMKNSKNKSESQKGWDVIKALRNWRDMKPLAESLKESLQNCEINDSYRAELLLGYMAGLPPAAKPSSD